MQHALGFQRLGNVVGAHGLVFFMSLGGHGVHQIEIKIAYPAGIQLAVYQRADVAGAGEAAVRQFVGQNKPFPGIAGGKTGLYRLLAFALDVGVGCVEIIESRRQKGIHHFAGGLKIHILARHGQAHQAEAEVFTDFRKKWIHTGASVFYFDCKSKPGKSKAKDG